MKKLLTKLPTFMLGAIVGIAVTAGSAVGAAAYLKVTQSNVKIVVDGTQAKLSDSPLNVNGKLYLPVRDTANAMGYSVESVTSSQVSLKENTSSSSNSASMSNAEANNTTASQNSAASKKVKNLQETYSTDGKLDAEKIRTALNNGSLDVNTQDSDSLNSLLHYVILENNYEAFKAINRNALNPDLQNSKGETPLHLAIQNENIFYFGELKKLKANPDLKDQSGKLAIEYADPKSSTYDSLKIYMF